MKGTAREGEQIGRELEMRFMGRRMDDDEHDEHSKVLQWETTSFHNNNICSSHTFVSFKG